MTTRRESSPAAPPSGPASATTLDGFEVLDACHRQTLETLNLLDALLARLLAAGTDAQAQTMARQVVRFFADTARLHHEDEERHVFPQLLASGDANLEQDVLRLQQDHAWLAEDWRDLAPQIEAVATGQGWVDLDTLREGVEVFAALSRDHIALEETCIYPAARERLGAGARQAMGREMAARRRAGERKPRPGP